MAADHTKMTVTILGSGTCVPSLERSSSSVLIQINAGFLLFDTGPGTMRRLLEAGVTIFDVSVVFYSHLHPDHSGELVTFLFANKYANGMQRQKPLTIVAAKGFKTFFSRLKTAYGAWIELAPELFNIVELDNRGHDIYSFDDFIVESLPVEHIDSSIAYKIIGPDGKAVVYSGDTDVSENLVALSKDADLLICEAALPDDFKVKGHLTPSLAGEMATRANVRQLVLTHFYPQCDSVDIIRECRRTYAGSLILAEDLMKIEL